jgi:Ser/Thr protein kinase RdoA (MazF antagonist)
MEAGRSALPLVPAILGRIEVDGRPGLIMERVDGSDLLTIIGRKPWRVFRAASITGQVHAQLHDVVAPPALPSLKDRIRGAMLNPLVPPHVVRFAMQRLDTLPDGDRLLHGDFHPGNILMSPHGPIVIDWPDATRGDPHADIARTVLLIRGGALPPGSPLPVRLGDRIARKIVLRGYRRSYSRMRRIDADLLQRWLIVRAADRLAEDIPEERDSLLKLLEDAGARA